MASAVAEPALSSRSTQRRPLSERVTASADDEEQWSFLFRTEGAVNLLYCPWSATEDYEFDGDIEGLDLPWSPDRRRLIEDGEATPDDEELRQWQRAKALELAGGA